MYFKSFYAIITFKLTKEKKMKNHGFTLIELLVVVLIIGILSSVALPQYTKAVEKSRAANAYQLIKSINDAQKLANLAQGTSGKIYPFEDLTLTFTDKDGNTATGYSFWGKDYLFVLGNQSSLGAAPTENRVEPAGAWNHGGSGGRGDYILSINNGRKTCGVVGSSAKGAEVCRAIVGGTTAATSVCVSGETCYTE